MRLAWILRLVLVLVLSASPLVASAMAAQDGRWSQVWADPLNGTPQVAEEEEVGHEGDVVSPSEEEATLWSLRASASPAVSHRHGEWGHRPATPPLLGDPTPPPERV